jgi:signal transduction histidine kinase
MRLCAQMEPSAEGTGLGLAVNSAIINGIVQNHGGEIIAESGREHGSIFRIKLPLGEGNG